MQRRLLNPFVQNIRPRASSIRYFPVVHTHLLGISTRNIHTTTAFQQLKIKTISKKKRGVRDVISDHDASNVPNTTRITKAVEIKKAIAVCTAENYDFKTLLPILQKNYILLPYITDDVYHIRLEEPNVLNDKISLDQGCEAEAFVFTDGTFVAWGANADQIQQLDALTKGAQINPYSLEERDEFDYFDDPTLNGVVTPEQMIIGGDLPAHQAKLAFSSGLARSVKLGALENLLEKHISKHRHIPHVLLQGKKLKYSRSEVESAVGELFLLRGQLNLHSELLDSPEFCWSSTKMEELFDRLSRNLDVRARIAIFNKKLDYANEVAEVLRNHLHDKHSLNLEWCIIILISVEIMFEIIHYADRIGVITLPNLRKDAEKRHF